MALLQLSNLCIGMTDEFVAQSILLHRFVTDLHDAFDYPNKR